MVSGNAPGNYRTQLLTQRQADAFAAALRGNQRFTGVGVHQSDRAKHPERRFFVLYQPSSAARRLDILNVHQATQDARAEEQWENYAVVRDEEEGKFWVANLTNGETYTVHLHRLFDCTCPQQQYRHRGTSLRCKHDGIVRTHLRLGLVEGFEAVTYAA